VIKGKVKIIDENGNVYEEHNQISSQFLNYLSTYFQQPPNVPTGYALLISPTSVNVPMQIASVDSSVSSPGVGVIQVLEIEFTSNPVTVTNTINGFTLLMNTLTGTVISVANFPITNSPPVGTTIRIVWTITVLVQLAGIVTPNSSGIQAIIANAMIPNAPVVNSSWALPSPAQTYVSVGGQVLYVTSQTTSGGSGVFSAIITGVPQQSVVSVVIVQIYSLGFLIATIDVDLSIFHLSNLAGTLVEIGFIINFNGS